MKKLIIKFYNLIYKIILMSLAVALVSSTSIASISLAAEGETSPGTEEEPTASANEIPENPTDKPSDEPSEKPSSTAFENPSEEDEGEEGVLPITISYTDFVLDIGIKSVTQIINGVESSTSQMSNKGLGKVEVYRKSVDSTKLKINLEINIKNEGNASGKVEKVYAYIPENVTNESSEWTQTEATTLEYSQSDLEIEANDSKTINLIIQGNASEIMGSNDISAMLISDDDIDQRIIEKTRNIEITESDDIGLIKNTNNFSLASLISSVSTGIKNNIIYILLALVVLITIAVIIKKRRVNRNI